MCVVWREQRERVFMEVEARKKVRKKKKITDSRELRKKTNTCGLKTDDLFILLHLLDNNIFSYEYIGIYGQIRGLAMGSRLSGILAILAMRDRFERLFIYRNLEPQLTIYVRYVDDIGTGVPNSDEAYRTLTYLNSKHPTIKFELKLPDSDGYLPILDISRQEHLGNWVSSLTLCYL